MALFIYKWCVVFALILPSAKPALHPYYVTVTEIEHNPKAQTLEVSCKIFTDDFENTLKTATGKKIDLLNSARREEMKPFVRKYIVEHLKIEADGKPVALDFLGYEPDEEGVIAYFESRNIKSVKSIRVINDLLYEFHPSQ
ncbi:MAG: hypothetical protein EOP48_30235, partial [Sphingobacteriales bacterium]